MQEDKQAGNTQPVVQQKRQVTQEERAKILARIIEVILADPGLPATEKKPASEQAD